MTGRDTPGTHDNSVLLLHAYLDGELDPLNALEMERRLAADPALAAERARIETLRRLLRERLPREEPSAALRDRITRTIGVREQPARPSWRALAASIAVTAIVASSSTWFLAQRPEPDFATEAVVAAHIRGLMAPQPADVASSERHTVKPWFNSRIPEAPRVVDLSAAGFPLVGGRVDVIGREPVPTVVYRRRQHVISVTALSRAQAAQIESHGEFSGYNIVQWADQNIRYLAVSDLNPAELQEFAKLFQTTN